MGNIWLRVRNITSW